MGDLLNMLRADRAAIREAFIDIAGQEDWPEAIVFLDAAMAATPVAAPPSDPALLDQLLTNHGYDGHHNAAPPSDPDAPLREALAKADEFLTRGSTFNGHTGPDPIAAHIVIEEALGRDV